MSADGVKSLDDRQGPLERTQWAELAARLRKRAVRFASEFAASPPGAWPYSMPVQEFRMPTKKTPPWERPAPRGKSGRSKLTPTQKAAAKARAAKAGRHYPNLMDNMWAAKKNT